MSGISKKVDKKRTGFSIIKLPMTEESLVAVSETSVHQVLQKHRKNS